MPFRRRMRRIGGIASYNTDPLAFCRWVFCFNAIDKWMMMCYNQSAKQIEYTEVGYS